MSTNPHNAAPPESLTAADVKAAAGATSESCCSSSGFGGLGLEGMVGNELCGAPPPPPGVGNAGITSGGTVGAVAPKSGKDGRIAGGAEMAEALSLRGKAQRHGAGFAASSSKRARRSKGVDLPQLAAMARRRRSFVCLLAMRD